MALRTRSLSPSFLDNAFLEGPLPCATSASFSCSREAISSSTRFRSFCRAWRVLILLLDDTLILVPSIACRAKSTRPMRTANFTVHFNSFRIAFRFCL